MKYLTAQEWTDFMAVITEQRDRAMFTVCYYRGLRASELHLIRRRHVDLDNRTIEIERLKHSNGGIYPLSPEEVAELTVWLSWLRPAPDQSIFPIRRAQVWVLFQRYAKLADIPEDKRHPHVLKHSIATHLLDKGLDMADVQDWLGHKSVTSTVIYAQVTSKRRKAAAMKAYEKGIL